MPPPMGNAIPRPRRSSMLPLRARPCHLILEPSHFHSRRGDCALQRSLVERLRPSRMHTVSHCVRTAQIQSLRMDLELRTKSQSSRARAGALGWHRPGRWRRKGAVSACARVGEARLREAEKEIADVARNSDPVLAVSADVSTAEGVQLDRREHGGSFWRHRYPRQQRRPRRRRRPAGDVGRPVAGKQSIKRSFRQSGRRVWSCRTCSVAAAGPS